MTIQTNVAGHQSYFLYNKTYVYYKTEIKHVILLIPFAIWSPISIANIPALHFLNGFLDTWNLLSMILFYYLKEKYFDLLGKKLRIKNSKNAI